MEIQNRIEFRKAEMERMRSMSAAAAEEDLEGLPKHLSHQHLQQ